MSDCVCDCVCVCDWWLWLLHLLFILFLVFYTIQCDCDGYSHRATYRRTCLGKRMVRTAMSAVSVGKNVTPCNVWRTPNYCVWGGIVVFPVMQVYGTLALEDNSKSIVCNSSIYLRQIHSSQSVWKRICRGHRFYSWTDHSIAKRPGKAQPQSSALEQSCMSVSQRSLASHVWLCG